MARGDTGRFQVVEDVYANMFPTSSLSQTPNNKAVPKDTIPPARALLLSLKKGVLAVIVEGSHTYVLFYRFSEGTLCTGLIESAGFC